jgi:hypothetical protein
LTKAGKKKSISTRGHTNTACPCNTLQSRTDFNATTNRERDGVTESFARALTCSLPAPQFAGRERHLAKDSSCCCCCCCSSREGLEFHPRDAYNGIALTAKAARRQHGCCHRRWPCILGENIKPQVKEMNCARRILLPPGVFLFRIL